MYIYSTLSAPQRYVKYAQQSPEGGTPHEDASILINGGANVADRHLMTPRGVVTKVTDEEYALLQENELFKLHVENGFITADEANVAPEKVADDMEGRDLSSPLVPGDFQVAGQPEPVVNTTQNAPAQTAVPKPRATARSSGRSKAKSKAVAK